MSVACQAWAEVYLGRGQARELYAGNCVLERGHDSDHLPHTLQAKQAYDQAFNAGVDAALAALGQVMADLRESDRLTIGADVLEVVKKARV